jgi:hypothetical protein
MAIEFVLAALNSVLIIGVIAMIVYLNSKISELENSVLDLFRYRSHNEIQLQNLINDINKNDEFLLNKED